jgi:hypothetical protein
MAGHLTAVCLTKIPSLYRLANKIDYFITIFNFRLTRIQGSRYLHEVLLLVLNCLIERFEQIMEKAHKAN